MTFGALHLTSKIRGGGTVVALAVSLMLFSEDARAQWVEAPGKGWVSAQAFHQDTRDRFDFNADNNEIPFDGHAKSTAVFVTAAVGLIPNWDLWARGSFNFLAFDDAAQDRSVNGPGDVNVWLRVAPLKYAGIDFPFAIRGGAKIPAGSSPIDAEIIPLSEGQWDWEVMAEVGHSFWPRSTYVNGWVGYRLRTLNEEASRNPGEEIFFLAQIGGALSALQYKLIAEGWDSDTPILEGISIPTAQRQYLQLTPSLSYPTAGGSFEVGWRFGLAGRNLPAGGALVIGYFTKF